MYLWQTLLLDRLQIYYETWSAFPICLTMVVCAGCGDSQSRSDSRQLEVAAQVGAWTISEDDITRAVPLAWPTTPETEPVPPHFTNCIRAKRASMGDGYDKATLKTMCKTDYFTHRSEALGMLIRDRWVALEARRRGIEPPASAVKRIVERNLETIDARTARRIRRSQRMYTDMIRNAARAERIRRLQELLGVPTQARQVARFTQLGHVLLKNYAASTRCDREYHRPNAQECLGRTSL